MLVADETCRSVILARKAKTAGCTVVNMPRVALSLATKAIRMSAPHFRTKRRIGQGVHRHRYPTMVLLIALVSPPAFAQPTEYMQRIQQDYRTLFASCDVDNDGILTREEASPCVRLAPLFDSMDVNRDGRVTPDEFERWLADIPIYAR